MENTTMVDGATFLKSIISEINNKDIVLNEYTFERDGDELIFYGNAGNYYICTKVIGDNQFINYYEMLVTAFNDDFSEMPALGIFGGGGNGSELYAIVNDKVIAIRSDNECDSWIWEKTIGTNKTKRK